MLFIGVANMGMTPMTENRTVVWTVTLSAFDVVELYATTCLAITGTVTIETAILGIQE